MDKKINNVSRHTLETSCCGCTACCHTCPVGAIQMTQNPKGFFVPQVDEALCIQCGKCLTACQIGKDNPGSEPLHKFGVVHRDEDVRMNCSSGGVFWALVSEATKEYGMRFHCFGAALNEDMDVVHTEAADLTDCEVFRGSKYVQSDLSHVFARIEELLREGQFVLFTGTGCQCTGLREYIKVKGIDDSDLLVVDLVCHGVPSRKMWKDYIRALEEKYGQKVTGYVFRNKQEGWRDVPPRAVLADGTDAEQDKLLRSYGKLFGNLALNKLCYSCKYANTKRVGDVTLGDYWGIENSDCTLDDGKGVSLCLVNTPKGERWFRKLAGQIKTYTIHDNSYLQPQLCRPTSRNILCDDFWADYSREGYLFVVNKYTGHTRLYRVFMKLTALVKKKFRSK